jgi:hypothetical protein
MPNGPRQSGFGLPGARRSHRRSGSIAGSLEALFVVIGPTGKWAFDGGYRDLPQGRPCLVPVEASRRRTGRGGGGAGMGAGGLFEVAAAAYNHNQ